MPQACGIGRGERRTPTDWVRTKREMHSGLSVQRMKRSTPTARPVPSGRRTNVNFNRRTEPRTKDQGQLRRFGPRWLRRTNVKLRSASIPSWETLWSTRATGITHPGFYGRKPWRKPNNATIITPAGTPAVCLTRDIAGIVRFSSCLVPQKFTFSAGNMTHWPAGYFHQSPTVTTRLTLRISSAFARALRVS